MPVGMLETYRFYKNEAAEIEFKLIRYERDLDQLGSGDDWYSIQKISAKIEKLKNRLHEVKSHLV